MVISTTATEDNRDSRFLVYHGPFCETIPRLASDGYQAVELHILDSSLIDRENLWRVLKENGVRLTSIGTGSVYSVLHFCLGSDDPYVREKTIRHLEQHMITAAPDHALVILGLIVGRFSDCADNAADFEKYVTESLYVLDRLAESYDVRLVLEPLTNFETDWIKTIGEGVEYLKHNNFKRIKLLIDTAIMNIEEADIGEAIRSGKGYIGHVHIADNDRWYPGHGHYDFHETIRALRDIGYDKVLAVETNCEPDEKTSAQKSLEYLKKVLNEVA